MHDIKTQAIVLRRTNFGESDRILNLLTPLGKKSALARGARKEKSKLAGGIEMFSVSEVVLHQGRSDLLLLTSAKMVHFYGKILTDLTRLEVASEALKKVGRLAEEVETAEGFHLTEQVLAGLDAGYPARAVETWFQFNLLRISGEQINLLTDVNNDLLRPDEHYVWDGIEKALKPLPAGRISGAEIKLMRLMLSSPLKIVAQVQNLDSYLPEVGYVAKSLS